MPDYEVIVIGAGPAGAMITKELAERNISVLCIEKEIEAGLPNKSTAATPLDTFELFNIPQSLGFDGLSGLRLFGPSESYIAEFDEVFARLFMFREVKQYLIKEAIRSGASMMVGTDVLDLPERDGKVAGVRYKGFSGEGSVSANVVVDATGPEALFSTKLGLMPKQPNSPNSKIAEPFEYFSKPGVGGAFEYFLGNAKPDKGKHGFFMDIFTGSEYIPGGYSWIFAANDHEVKAGVCKMDPTYTVPNEKSQKEYFQKLWDENPQIKNAQPFELHLCPYRHWVIGGLKSTTLDNFIAIGDAATKFQPVFGEGVRASFYSARFAAEAIEEARKRNDYSKEVLALHDKLWEEKWGRNWNFSTILYGALYKSDDKQLDDIIRQLRKFDIRMLFRLYMGKGTKADYLSLLKHLPGLTGMGVDLSLLKRIPGFIGKKLFSE